MSIRRTPKYPPSQTRISVQDTYDAGTPQGTAQINEEFRRIQLGVNAIADKVEAIDPKVASIEQAITPPIGGRGGGSPLFNYITNVLVSGDGIIGKDGISGQNGKDGKDGIDGLVADYYGIEVQTDLTDLSVPFPDYKTNKINFVNPSGSLPDLYVETPIHFSGSMASDETLWQLHTGSNDTRYRADINAIAYVDLSGMTNTIETWISGYDWSGILSGFIESGIYISGLDAGGIEVQINSGDLPGWQAPYKINKVNFIDPTALPDDYVISQVVWSGEIIDDTTMWQAATGGSDTRYSSEMKGFVFVDMSGVYSGVDVYISGNDWSGYFSGALLSGEKGEKGDQGDPGISGAKGDTGDKGDKGDKGDQGIPGTNGTDGIDGASGYTPQKGVDYKDGEDGEDGSSASAIGAGWIWYFTNNASDVAGYAYLDCERPDDNNVPMSTVDEFLYTDDDMLETKTINGVAYGRLDTVKSKMSYAGGWGCHNQTALPTAQSMILHHGFITDSFTAAKTYPDKWYYKTYAMSDQPANTSIFVKIYKLDKFNTVRLLRTVDPVATIVQTVAGVIYSYEIVDDTSASPITIEKDERLIIEYWGKNDSGSDATINFFHDSPTYYSHITWSINATPPNADTYYLDDTDISVPLGIKTLLTTLPADIGTNHYVSAGVAAASEEIIYRYATAQATAPKTYGDIWRFTTCADCDHYPDTSIRADIGVLAADGTTVTNKASYTIVTFADDAADRKKYTVVTDISPIDISLAVDERLIIDYVGVNADPSHSWFVRLYHNDSINFSKVEIGGSAGIGLTPLGVSNMASHTVTFDGDINHTGSDQYTYKQCQWGAHSGWITPEDYPVANLSHIGEWLANVNIGHTLSDYDITCWRRNAAGTETLIDYINIDGLPVDATIPPVSGHDYSYRWHYKQHTKEKRFNCEHWDYKDRLVVKVGIDTAAALSNPGGAVNFTVGAVNRYYPSWDAGDNEGLIPAWYEDDSSYDPDHYLSTYEPSHIRMPIPEAWYGDGGGTYSGITTVHNVGGTHNLVGAAHQVDTLEWVDTLTPISPAGTIPCYGKFYLESEAEATYPEGDPSLRTLIYHSGEVLITDIMAVISDYNSGGTYSGITTVHTDGLGGKTLIGDPHQVDTLEFADSVYPAENGNSNITTYGKFYLESVAETVYPEGDPTLRTIIHHSGIVPSDGITAVLNPFYTRRGFTTLHNDDVVHNEFTEEQLIHNSIVMNWQDVVDETSGTKLPVNIRFYHNVEDENTLTPQYNNGLWSSGYRITTWASGELKESDMTNWVSGMDWSGYFSGMLISGANGTDGASGYTPIKGVDYFDGEDGASGYTPIKGVDYFDGEKGDSGYTPVKGIDYFDGTDGTNGTDGASGYTPIKGVDYFDGEKGEKGDSGYTPIKGVDYFDGVDGQDGIDGTSYSGITTVHNVGGTHNLVGAAHQVDTLEWVDTLTPMSPAGTIPCYGKFYLESEAEATYPEGDPSLRTLIYHSGEVLITDIMALISDYNSSGTMEEVDPYFYAWDKAAHDIVVEASGFDGNLTSGDVNVQLCMQKLDDLVIPDAVTLPAGTENQTLRYNASNELEANDNLLAQATRNWSKIPFAISPDDADQEAGANAALVVKPLPTGSRTGIHIRNTDSLQYGVIAECCSSGGFHLQQTGSLFTNIGFGANQCATAAFRAVQTGQSCAYGLDLYGIFGAYINCREWISSEIEDVAFKVLYSGLINANKYYKKGVTGVTNQYNNLVSDYLGNFEKQLKNIGILLTDQTITSDSLVDIPNCYTSAMRTNYYHCEFRIILKRLAGSSAVNVFGNSGLQFQFTNLGANEIEILGGIRYEYFYLDGMNDQAVGGAFDCMNLEASPYVIDNADMASNSTTSAENLIVEGSFTFLQATDNDTLALLIAKTTDADDYTVEKGSFVKITLKNEG